VVATIGIAPHSGEKSLLEVSRQVAEFLVDAADPFRLTDGMTSARCVASDVEGEFQVVVASVVGTMATAS
jgi:hypothetical protein